jgi:hypothetical protein
MNARSVIETLTGGRALSVNHDVQRNLAAAKGVDYATFLRKTDSLHVFNLYRGGKPVENLSFMTDAVSHAREYADGDESGVDGIVCDSADVLRFDSKAFEELRRAFAGLTRRDLIKIYEPLSAKLGSAAEAVAFAFKFLRSDVPYEDVSWDVQKNDMLVPLMVHYARSKGKNVIVFLGSDYGDYGGQDEYVVDDASRYPKLSDLWKQANHMQESREPAAMRRPLPGSTSSTQKSHEARLRSVVCNAYVW